MLIDSHKQTSSQIWVEIRVDDGNDNNAPRHISHYIGWLGSDTIEAWTRIEHGECWFVLTDVLWYYTPPAQPAAPQKSWFSSLTAEDIESKNDLTEPIFHPLIRQSEKADYWGYADQLYLRLDRVYRIIPLTSEYIEHSVMPALQRKKEKTISE